jgi:hypothetical protein
MLICLHWDIIIKQRANKFQYISSCFTFINPSACLTVGEISDSSTVVQMKRQHCRYYSPFFFYLRSQYNNANL